MRRASQHVHQVLACFDRHGIDIGASDVPRGRRGTLAADVREEGQEGWFGDGDCRAVLWGRNFVWGGKGMVRWLWRRGRKGGRTVVVR